jgi:DNA helicase-2/ATP-dependent DNA helicase PcrA
MASELVLAVAGSGKTRQIIESIDMNERVLILTYTVANCENLKKRIVERFGYMPMNVHVHTYISFLHGFCFRPFLQDRFKTKGVIFQAGPQHVGGLRRFISPSRYLYNNRLYKFVKDEVGVSNLLERFERFYDRICIDEVQDFAGHDFDLVEDLAGFGGQLLCVGDYFQYTYDTSRDGLKNANLHNTYDGYIRRFENKGFLVDTTSLGNSYRCSPSVCNVVNSLGIEIHSHRDVVTDVIRITNSEDIIEVCSSSNIINLFYERSDKYPINSMNWAKSKGIDHFNDVCVVLNNGTRNYWNSNSLEQLNDRTKRKLYVALTRTKGTLYIVDESMVRLAYGID